jgi:hypothetical protein
MTGAEEFLAQGSVFVFTLHKTSLLEDWNHAIDKVYEGPRRHHVGQIEAVNSNERFVAISTKLK